MREGRSPDGDGYLISSYVHDWAVRWHIGKRLLGLKWSYSRVRSLFGVVRVASLTTCAGIMAVNPSHRDEHFESKMKETEMHRILAIEEAQLCPRLHRCKMRYLVTLAIRVRLIGAPSAVVEGASLASCGRGAGAGPNSLLPSAARHSSLLRQQVQSSWAPKRKYHIHFSQALK